MSDFITPITTFTLTGTVQAYSLQNFNGLGLSSSGRLAGGNTGNIRNAIVDQVSLSAEAQRYIATTSSFPGRTAGLTALTGSGVVFEGVDISGASFVGQALDGAAFTNAVLKNVDFTGSSLVGATFVSSLVDGARFNQANLSGANLAGAQGLNFAQVEGAIFDAKTVSPQSIGSLILGTFGAAGGTPFLFGT